MKSNIRITLSEQASVELLELMKALNINSPTHAANVIIDQFYKLQLLSPSEELNDQHRTSQH